ncbi:hypothetical protein BCV69DRAFT_296581 [Microstroma glucosiphilum]|uniref:C2H2-type domain-containing protein n=1 Tax=Pseudomicrostroma glucosiphilum TaxID=1684307 RepID=A0A316UHB1_9BASI|nr:hypothetical protein BCV69DRAFT_296581 [Pseudomicrostroma glucosiphilum]PWN24298.1 hypothetical protein BCV69DRAFT_296581 [Pseudomicrostroma glucosiphilum]
MAPPTADEQQQAATSAFLAAMQHSHQQLQQQQQRQQQQQQMAGVAGGEAAMQQSQQQQQYHLPPSYTQQQQQPPLPMKRDQTEDDGDDDDDEDDASPSGSGGQAKAPPRKAPRRSSGSNTKAGSSASAAAGSHSAGDNPPGPPYVCPACKTTYSRLEYLRRHERRHQDIRPFVCECGKGFSRSDVLSRHKKQCHYHLTGEQPSAEAAEAASRKTRKPSSATNARSRKTSSSGGGVGGSGGAGGSGSQAGGSGDQSPQPGQPYPNSQGGDFGNNAHTGQAPSLLPQAGAPGGMGLPPPPPFYSQHPTNAAAAAAAAAAVAAGHGGPSGQAGAGPGSGGVGAGGAPQSSSAAQDGNAGNQTSANTDYSRANGFMSAIHHALNTFGHHNSHSNYPPSPESNVSSRNSSPRLHYRDAIPYTHRSGSTGGGSRQSSLRKGTLDPYHAPVPWGADNQDGRSSPAPGSSTSRPGSLFGKDGGSANQTRSSSGAAANAGAAGAGVGSGVGLPGFSSSASPAGAPSFSYPANEFAAQSSTSSGNSQSQTLAPAGTDGQNNAGSGSQQGQQGQQPSSHPHSRADPPRFAVSTGPLSPFSGMGLASSMSPYLSAFSNARDTPLVASPGRGIAPGTPTSSLNTNVFDFTMRPPPKPASTASQGRNGSGSAPDGNNKGAQGPSSSSSGSVASKSRGPIATTSPQGGHDPSTPSASVSAADGGSLPALADFIDDQQRSAANGLLTLLGGGGAETPSRFVRSDTGRPVGAGAGNAQGGEAGTDNSNTTAGAQSSSSSSQTGRQNRPDNKSSSAMESNPGTNSADPSSNPFFEPAVTPGPEAFFLRLQGGEQDHRAGMSSSSGANNVGGNSIGGHYSHLPSSVVNGLLRDGIGQHQQNSDSAPSGGAGVDTPNYGMGSGGWGDFGLSNGSAGNVGWLLSPSIQALISSFATGATPGIGGDASGGGYFALARNHGPSAMGATPSLKPIMASSMDIDGGAQAEGKPAAINGAANGNVTTKEGSGPEGEKVSFIDLGTLALEKAFDDIKNPFYLPRSMFKTCYSVPHWHLPSRARLSMLAMHSQQNLCKHVPILHEPTFRLDSTPGCLAFAVCMLGCHEVGRRWFGGLEVVPLEKAISTAEDKPSIEDGKDGLARDEEDNQELVKPIVMTEKMDMLMRSFPSRCTHVKDKVSVVQALLLSQTSNFLSSDTTVRAIASISHSSVVGLARKAGFFDPSAEHVSVEIDYAPEVALQRLLADNNELAFAFSFLPSYLPSCSDEEKVWRLWCEYEGRRRTAFLLFLMDTVASLDAGVPIVVKIDEVKHLPLPAPDFIWRASDAKSFRTALESYKAPILDGAMAELLKDEEEEGEGEGEEQKADKGAVKSQSAEASSPTLLAGQHGPFARLIAILPILRGIVHLLQDRTDKPSPLQSWLPPSHSAGSDDATNEVKNEEGTEEEQIDAQVDLFKRALSRWREGWDQDPLCLQASSPVAQAKAEAARKAEELVSQSVGGGAAADAGVKAEGGEASKVNGGSGEPTKPNAAAVPSLATIFTSKTASGAVPLCEDALPFYWLSHVLLGHATSQQVSTSSPTNRQTGESTNGNGKQERGRQTSSTASSAGTGGGSGASSPSEDRKRKNSSTAPAPLPSSTAAAAAGGGSSTGGQRRVPDFRNMLRFAKTFVKSGEGVNGTTSGGQLAFTPAAAAAAAAGVGMGVGVGVGVGAGKEEEGVDAQVNGGKKE